MYCQAPTAFAGILLAELLGRYCLCMMEGFCQAYLTKEVLQGQLGGVPCWAGATAGGSHRQGLLLHDALVGGLQS